MQRQPEPLHSVSPEQVRHSVPQPLLYYRYPLMGPTLPGEGSPHLMVRGFEEVLEESACEPVAAASCALAAVQGGIHSCRHSLVETAWAWDGVPSFAVASSAVAVASFAVVVASEEEGLSLPQRM